MYIQGNQESQVSTLSKDHHYRYAYGRSMHPNSRLHQEVLTRIMNDVMPSQNIMQSRYEDFKKIDRNLTAFIPKGTGDTLIQAADSRRPITMVVPMTFVVRETLLTHLAQTFLNDIYFPYDGVGPEDIPGNILLQHCVQQQLLRTKAELAFLAQWSDILSYGMGVCAPYWHEEYGNVMQTEPTGYNNWRGKFIQTGESRSTRRKLLWSGNAFDNIDMYRYFPDTRVPAHLYQRGTKLGWLTIENRLDLLAREKQGKEGFMNCKYLDSFRGKSVLNVDENGRRDFSGETTYRDEDDVDILWRYYYLIPSEWGLSNDDTPQKWMFAVANDRVIVRSQPLNLNHNLFPVSVGLMNFDGYSISPRGKLEIIYGLQMTADWIFSTRIMNVTKCLGDTYIYDPWRLNSNDMKKPGPKLVKTRRGSWGTGVKDAIMPIPSNDVTQNHFAMTSYIADLIQRVSGASDALQGMMDNAPERRTKAEYLATRGSAQSRVNLGARVIYITSMRDLAHMAAAHTMQFQTQEEYVRLTGDWPRRLATEYGLDTKNNRVLVKPSDMDINCDVSPLTGMLPSSDDPEMMLNLFTLAVQNPVLSARKDIVRMYDSLARRLGEKNIEEFTIQVQPTPDDQVQNMYEDGKLEPLR